MITGSTKDTSSFFAKESGIIDEYDRDVLILHGSEF